MNEISTAGILVKYKEETTAGTRPTSGYTTIPNIKGLPDINPDATALDATDLSDTVWKRYIDGLRDPGSDIALTANLTSALKDAWNGASNSVMSKYAALTGGKRMWFEFNVPGIGSFFFAGAPQSLGFGGAEVDAIAEIELHITPTAIEGWANASS